MFDNIGSKIKTTAKAICIILIICFVVVGLIQITHHAGSAGVITMLSGALTAWLSTLALYGFGELIENVQDIKFSLCKTENSLKKVLENTAPPSKPMPTGWGLGKCELCDKTDILVCDAKIVDEMGTRYLKACKECFKNNRNVFPANDN